MEMDTTLETNMEPENHPVDTENHLPNRPTFFFGFHVSFRECIWFDLERNGFEAPEFWDISKILQDPTPQAFLLNWLKHPPKSSLYTVYLMMNMKG